MKTLISTVCSLTLLISTQSVLARDMENGGELHEESCVRCHSSDVYTRSDRKIKNLPSLGKQVRFCKNNLGVTWFEDEVSDVIDYLSVKHYKF